MELSLTRVSFTKEQLSSLDQKEVLFVIQLTNSLQEIVTFQKLIYLSMPETEDKVKIAAENSQTLFMCRLLAGLLFESWNIVISRPYKNVVDQYERLLDQTTIKSLNLLRDYFMSEDNLIKKIRNEYAYHYKFHKIRDCYDRLAESQQLDLFLAEQIGNCRFTASDLIINTAIFNSLNVADFIMAVSDFLQEIDRVVKAFIDFSGECLKIFAERCPKSYIEEIHLDEIPYLDELRLPYFVADRQE